MTYIARVYLNPRRKATQELLDNRQVAHAAVEATVFTPEGEHEHRRLLWRLTPREHDVELLIVSPAKPSLEHIVEQFGWPGQASETASVTDYDTFIESVDQGQRVSFALTASPQKQVPGTRNKRALRDPEEAVQWLQERAEKIGLGIDRLEIKSVSNSTAKRSSGRLGIFGVTFAGHATVSDPEALRSALANGIGKHKAHGMGLLTVASL